jgi:hypothetical protein
MLFTYESTRITQTSSNPSFGGCVCSTLALLEEAVAARLLAMAAAQQACRDGEDRRASSPAGDGAPRHTRAAVPFFIA